METRLALLLFPLVLVVAPSCKGQDSTGPTPPAAPSAPAPSATTPPPEPTAPSSSGGRTAGGPFEGTITMRVTEGTLPPLELTFLAKGSKVRLDTPGRDGKAAHAIYDASTSQLIVLSDAQKTATKTTAATNDGGDDKVATIKKTGIHETISGHDCEDWDVAESNSKHESICVVSGIPFFDPASIPGHGGGVPSFGSWMKGEKTAFPLRVISSAATGAIDSRMQILLMDAHPVDDSSFAAPPGYRAIGK